MGRQGRVGEGVVVAVRINAVLCMCGEELFFFFNSFSKKEKKLENKAIS